MLLGEWLNGRVVVSKTIGCVFESRLPCQTAYLTGKSFFFITFWQGDVSDTQSLLGKPVALHAIGSS